MPPARRSSATRSDAWPAHRTVLVVSHRLRLASVADEIAVIDAGRVTESGGRPTLPRDGAYRRLLDVRQADPEPEAGP